MLQVQVSALASRRWFLYTRGSDPSEIGIEFQHLLAVDSLQRNPQILSENGIFTAPIVS
jgi:hypothetical protein